MFPQIWSKPCIEQLRFQALETGAGVFSKHWKKSRARFLPRQARDRQRLEILQRKHVYFFLTPARCLLITAGALFARWWRRKHRYKNMNDLIYIGAIAAFFALCALYVRWCARQ